MIKLLMPEPDKMSIVCENEYEKKFCEDSFINVMDIYTTRYTKYGSFKQYCETVVNATDLMDAFVVFAQTKRMAWTQSNVSELEDLFNRMCAYSKMEVQGRVWRQV